MLNEARSLLLGEVEKDSRNDMARIIRQIETEAREEGDKRARKLIVDAIQRVASDNVAGGHHIPCSLAKRRNERPHRWP